MAQNFSHKLGLRAQNKSHSIWGEKASSATSGSGQGQLQGETRLLGALSAGGLGRFCLWRLHDLPAQPFVLLDCPVLAPFFLISTQKPDIKCLGLQKEAEGVCCKFSTSVLLLCNLFRLTL